MFNIKKIIYELCTNILLLALNILITIYSSPIGIVGIIVFSCCIIFNIAEAIGYSFVAKDPMKIVFSKMKISLFFSDRKQLLRYLSIHLKHALTTEDHDEINGRINLYFHGIKSSGDKVDRIELDQAVVDIIVDVIKPKIAYAEKIENGKYYRKSFNKK